MCSLLLSATTSASRKWCQEIRQQLGSRYGDIEAVHGSFWRIALYREANTSNRDGALGSMMSTSSDRNEDVAHEVTCCGRSRKVVVIANKLAARCNCELISRILS